MQRDACRRRDIDGIGTGCHRDSDVDVRGVERSMAEAVALGADQQRDRTLRVGRDEVAERFGRCGAASARR